MKKISDHGQGEDQGQAQDTPVHQTFDSPRPTKKKISSVTSMSVVNSETGEEESREESTTSRIPTEPPYVKLYLDDVAKLHDLSNGQKGLLNELLKEVSYVGTINLNASVKRKIATALNYKNKQSVDNALSKLCKENVIARIDTGVYEVNPYLFGKGKWPAIAKRRENFDNMGLTMIIKYTSNGGRTIETKETNDEDGGQS